ncbi:MAG: hypothetical protein Pg6C_20710 [Treponemataceae bacterium]|nr:MAG: hypothetical protein Pg6C_20710 [Treponemataceae bacterium]
MEAVKTAEAVKQAGTAQAEQHEEASATYNIKMITFSLAEKDYSIDIMKIKGTPRSLETESGKTPTHNC